MDVLGRDRAPFSGRVWHEIDAAVGAVKTANCTARRFLQVDGPYGLGLTSLSGDDGWLDPRPGGAPFGDWGVQRPGAPALDADPDQIGGRGTFILHSSARPVALIASEFILGIRNVEAFDDECQPLELYRAARAARDVALEEERLIYYGNPGSGYSGLLSEPEGLPPLLLGAVAARRQATRLELLPPPGQAPGGVARAIQAAGGTAAFAQNFQNWAAAQLAALQINLRDAIDELADRGFAGPYALSLSAEAYKRLFSLAPGNDTLLVDALRQLFAMGIHMAPVIRPDRNIAAPLHEGFGVGVLVTASRSYVRLVIGQDWTTAYRGSTGVFHRFVILSSFRLEITEPRAIQRLLL